MLPQQRLSFHHETGINVMTNKLLYAVALAFMLISFFVIWRDIKRERSTPPLNITLPTRMPPPGAEFFIATPSFSPVTVYGTIEGGSKLVIKPNECYHFESTGKEYKVTKCGRN